MREMLVVVGAAYVYACGGTNAFCFHENSASKFTLTINSSGCFYSNSKLVAKMDKAGTLNITKGRFVSKENKYMFHVNGAYNTTYVGGSSTSERTFGYMTGCNRNLTTTKYSGCYYLSK